MGQGWFDFPPQRALAWFSCGAASAVASKLAAAKYPEMCEIIYCDTLAFEHPDNTRFIADCIRWFNRPVKMLKSDEYDDIYDVFDRTGWLVGAEGARCTTELKKNVRKAYQRIDDLHVFGFTADEQNRVDQFHAENPDVMAEFPLIDAGITKADCFAQVKAAGIELPAMYRLGYRNNNCIGCVKGGMGYWNKIRQDFPEAFDRMAAQERKMGVTILKDRRNGEEIRMYLDELEPGRGRYSQEKSIECGVLCEHGI